MGKLDGKAAVITGGASGMGRATALRFLEEGASVVIADYNEMTGRETLELAGRPPTLRFIKVNVAEEADVQAMISLAVTDFGGLDILFNNAGIGGAFGPITETTVEDWDYTFDVLLKGVFLGIKHGARAMINQGRGGAIVNTASVAGLSGGSGPQVYSAAKAGVINLTQSTAVELAPYGIRVNAICPGAVLTPLATRGRTSVTEAGFENVQPLPMTGQPEHIAAAALFLSSDDSEFITGEALVVDGGLTAAGPKLMHAGRGFRSAGVTHGSTGLEPTIRRLDS